jgi:thiol:disulfide interchange protein DsbD
VKYQGCADAGVCYPPQTRTLTVALPQAESVAESVAKTETETPPLGFGKKSGGLFSLGEPTGKLDAAPLPPEQAFTSEVIALSGNRLLLRLTPAKGYYLYRDKLSARLDAGAGLATALPAASALPKASPYKDAHFGNVAVYFDQVEISLPVTRSTPQAAKGSLMVGLQGCQTDGICYPPMTRKLAVALPAGTVVATNAIPALPLKGREQSSATPESPLSTSPEAAALKPSSSRGGLGGDGVAGDGPARQPPPSSQTPSLLAALALALLGGLILNLMPCVLPVLSLKVLAVVQSGESRARARGQALAYTAGILLSMLLLGSLILNLRSGGLEDWISWGFQLQFPRMVAVLALVMFALGLSLSGVWHLQVALPQRGLALTQSRGYRADFFTGVLAVVLATPCTAPFMGAALAYAFTGPLVGALLVFLLLGLGLALPFLLIGFVPALARFLPKPGAWMETLKQLLAFPLYATAAWLAWVLTNQRGADAVGLWLTAAILLALAAWAWTRARSGGGRWGLVLAPVALLAALWPIHTLGKLPVPMADHAQGENAVAYSEQALADLRAQGRVVFVNMTADWCVSCKANEKAVFSRPGFRQALSQANAVYMIGDYTNVDPAISAFLRRYGAVGVPLYVVYPRTGGEGRVLPTLLTPGMAESAIQEAAR